jgi:hypothetical protein
MKTRNFASFQKIENSLKFLAVSSVALGVAAIMPAAPAGAVVINSGSLAFNDGAALATGSSIGTTGGTFNVNFNPGGNAIVTNASGSFSSLIPGVVDPAPSVARAIAPSNGTSFSYTAVSGNTFTATLQNALNFDFGGSIGRLNVGAGATFTGLYLPANPSSPVFASGHSFFGLASGSASFINGSDTSTQILSSFNFDVDNTLVGNTSPNGSYSLVTSSTAVPEPFTIIGTIVGGTAAFRMRKKLANPAKK